MKTKNGAFEAKSSQGANTPNPEEMTSHQGMLHAAGAAIAKLNGRPCLVLARSEIRRGDMELMYEAMQDLHAPEIDVLLSSCGGNIEGAYSIARSLRRRFDRVRIYVPHIAKSAATLVCLAADEIVIGPLGELGPMDVQSSLVSSAAVTSDASALLPFQALASLDGSIREELRETIETISRATGVRPAGVVGQAVDLISKVYRPIYGQLDPMRIAEWARGLQIGVEYGMRMLCRYHGAPVPVARRIIQQLIHGYPSHDFIIDLEEARSIGLPARGCLPAELPIMREVGRALLAASGSEPDLVQLVEPCEEGCGGGEQSQEAGASDSCAGEGASEKSDPVAEAA